MTAEHGEDFVKCSLDNTLEVRRGDALLVGDCWFRVDCRIEGSRSNQPERAKPPLTVSSVESHDRKGRNVYCKKFDGSVIPLDGDFDGNYDDGNSDSTSFIGKAFKHGCSNDIRDLWHTTAEKVEPFKSENVKFDTALENELIRLKLLTRPGISLSPVKFRSQHLNYLLFIDLNACFHIGHRLDFGHQTAETRNEAKAHEEKRRPKTTVGW